MFDITGNVVALMILFLISSIFLFFQDADMYSDRHALIVPPSTGYGNRVYPAPFTDSSAPRMCLLL